MKCAAVVVPLRFFLARQVLVTFIRAKRVSNCYIQEKKSVCSTNLGFSMMPGTYYVPDTYVPGISRQKSIRTYVMLRPWTHTSDDSYIYQLSLVVATATVSF